MSSYVLQRPQKFIAKIQVKTAATVTRTMLALATLGNLTLIRSIIFVSICAMKPGKAQSCVPGASGFTKATSPLTPSLQVLYT
jgi:hypothetical protein